jgi:hypothetical protein
MVFLLLSYQYPTPEQRKAYLKEVGPAFAKTVSPFHKLLPAATNDEGWTQIMQCLRAHMDESRFRKTTEKRAVRPNDDNYYKFCGEQWEPAGDFGVPPAMASMMRNSNSSNNEEEPIPHYDHCANCTTAALTTKKLRCSRCKFVSYCSKECQAQHWKSVHRNSCVPAQEVTLEEAMSTNDGFYITPEECLTISASLRRNQQGDNSHLLIKPFAVYFEHAGKYLNGCFVI